MPISDDFLRIDLASVVVLRDDRQRRKIYDAEGYFVNHDGLLESVRRHGVIQPIIINRELVLVAGERRLEASRCIGLTTIPARFVEDLSETEAKVLELEENLRRADLPWRDEVLAIAQLHELYKSAKPDQTLADTERATGYTQLMCALRVARDIDSPRIASCTHLRQAYNVLARVDERATADAVNDIIDAGAAVFAGIGAGAQDAGGSSNGAGGATGAGSAGTHHGAAHGHAQTHIPAAQPSESIVLAKFADWAAQYTGPSFNLIHCDFPYGIDVFAGAMSGRNSHTTYSDTQGEYIGLIEALCANLPKLMSHSAHLVFWCTADIEVQWRTIELFRKLAPSLIFHQKPLIWHKTDNIGMLSDPKRIPRHVYETALVASQEDRLILRAVSDTYGAPTDKSHHPSTKPEPVLRHFFQMYCDEHTRLLDPTCGSGSALRAAESLGAKFVLGIESNEEHYKAAQSALRNFRTLRKVTK
jgi:ParB/RepB/Spo0J family partition protein